MKSKYKKWRFRFKITNETKAHLSRNKLRYAKAYQTPHTLQTDQTNPNQFNFTISILETQNVSKIGSTAKTVIPAKRKYNI